MIKRTVRNSPDLLLSIKPAKEYTGCDIRNLRVRLCLSQAMFAKLCGLSTGTLQRWEQSKSRPFPGMFRLFDILNKRGIEYIT